MCWFWKRRESLDALRAEYFGCNGKPVCQEKPKEESLMDKYEREKWERTRYENAQADKDHEANLYADQDDEALSRDWVPSVGWIGTRLGTMIAYGGVEFNAAYTTEITVTPGEPPCRKATYGGGYWAVPATKSVLEITSVSGNKKYIRVSRHKADALFAEIMRLWRQYR